MDISTHRCHTKCQRHYKDLYLQIYWFGQILLDFIMNFYIHSCNAGDVHQQTKYLILLS
jgi:hypothetical protein